MISKWHHHSSQMPPTSLFDPRRWCCYSSCNLKQIIITFRRNFYEILIHVIFIIINTKEDNCTWKNCSNINQGKTWFEQVNLFFLITFVGTVFSFWSSVRRIPYINGLKSHKFWFLTLSENLKKMQPGIFFDFAKKRKKKKKVQQRKMQLSYYWPL